MRPDEAMAQAAARYGAGDFEGARALCQSILLADPRHFYALHLLATLAAQARDWAACEEIATRALAIDPDHVEVLSNRGAARRMLDRYEEALADYDRALRREPGNAEALNNRAVALAALNRHDEAIASYDRALALKPGYARARFNRSLSHLVLGHFEAGWEDHEARWEGGEWAKPQPHGEHPAWDGRADLRGRTILLHTEQGLGDAIQFARYVPAIAARAGRVVLQVHRPLKELLAPLVAPGDTAVLGEPTPRFDLQLPIVSLARVLGTRLESIPAAVPYLAAPAEHLERWRERLAKIPRPRVGIAWSGSLVLRNDRHRSIPLARLGPLREAGVSLVSMQKEVRDEDVAALRALGIPHFGDELADFRDTAALAAEMDLIVSVDTSIVHLAGALARPVWVLLPFSPDWRWLLGREDSPWYPTMRLLRQPRIGDWDAVLDRALAGLRALAAAGPSALQ